MREIHSHPRMERELKVPYGHAIVDAVHVLPYETQCEEWCEWVRCAGGGWETSCRHRHLFIEGGVKENRFLACPYCTRSIKLEDEKEDPT